ncbi:MAG: RpiB/LacA/LacB family sugar-phosphate isomerase [Actinomycetaceae bacterium]|nr:RpiB/LacA/LacB family sugar-phosphate isomerase [Actinomycetaceae bacterium]
MKVVVAAPSNGLVLAGAIRDYLQADRRVDEVVDMLDPSGGYPQVSVRAAEVIARGDADRAVLVCGTGIGTAIAASTVTGVRAATAHDLFSVVGAVANYDAQILCMGQNVIAAPAALPLIDAWLEASHDPEGPYGPMLKELKELAGA